MYKKREILLSTRRIYYCNYVVNKLFFILTLASGSYVFPACGILIMISDFQHEVPLACKPERICRVCKDICATCNTASTVMVIVPPSATDLFNPVLASSSPHFTEMMALVGRI
ncbi:PREDICTED: uncharacterized protein LOC105459686 [Wasmannia auropunctata]|uniref:uncharacterized protein LOC105459686 n=1 Tax=Wasmannia auropunctata TaxID=64793 RepID=UPI0005F013B3|nr:PREDICTED: uncharacterized protein LOC105459686 [Wasmannia auropunctata]